jgi:DNA modification methylase
MVLDTAAGDRHPSVEVLAQIANAVRAVALAVDEIGSRCLTIHADNRVVLGQFPSESVHCTISSPPYGDQKNYGSPNELGSGNKDYACYLDDLRRIIGELYRITVDGGVLWLVLDTLKRNGQSIPLPFHAIELATKHGWSFQECVIWDKGKSLPWSHRAHFRGVFEYVLLFVKGRVRHFDLDSVRDADQLSSYWIKYPERFHPLGKSPTDLWHIPIPVQGSWSSTDLRHLCPFPEELVRRMIALTSMPGDVVLDPFAGTGIVPAVASTMDRIGIGIELNTRYYRAFKRGGYERISKSASTRPKRETDDLSRLIYDLRILKYPKTLFSQISRADRLGDGVRRMVDALLVNRDETSTSGERHRIRVTLLASAHGHVRALKNAAEAAASIPPLSKFGLDASIEVVEPERWRSSSYRPVRAGDTWYRYQAGAFNKFAERMDPEQMKTVLRDRVDAKRTRVPPIFSRIGVNVLAGISD